MVSPEPGGWFACLLKVVFLYKMSKVQFRFEVLSWPRRLVLFEVVLRGRFQCLVVVNGIGADSPVRVFSHNVPTAIWAAHAIVFPSFRALLNSVQAIMHTDTDLHAEWKRRNPSPLLFLGDDRTCPLHFPIRQSKLALERNPAWHPKWWTCIRWRRQIQDLRAAAGLPWRLGGANLIPRAAIGRLLFGRNTPRAARIWTTDVLVVPAALVPCTADLHHERRRDIARAFGRRRRRGPGFMAESRTAAPNTFAPQQFARCESKRCAAMAKYVRELEAFFFGSRITRVQQQRLVSCVAVFVPEFENVEHALTR